MRILHRARLPYAVRSPAVWDNDDYINDSRAQESQQYEHFDEWGMGSSIQDEPVLQSPAPVPPVAEAETAMRWHNDAGSCEGVQIQLAASQISDLSLISSQTEEPLLSVGLTDTEQPGPAQPAGKLIQPAAEQHSSAAWHQVSNCSNNILWLQAVTFTFTFSTYGCQIP